MTRTGTAAGSEAVGGWCFRRLDKTKYATNPTMVTNAAVHPIPIPIAAPVLKFVEGEEEGEGDGPVVAVSITVGVLVGAIEVCSLICVPSQLGNVLNTTNPYEVGWGR